MRWVFFGGIVLFGLMLALLVFSDFADVPCQDGVWDATKKTCVPHTVGPPGGVV